ncbi:DUF2846 domain-containing protein [Catenovulum maritimum]|uniref:DUF2846 domain-containing protein n=1 Tax=Catenovulum maritimum TaxID=1513271 RepID=A0A0J8GRA5_9ALTE|nr:DUF2846 domain-containing protein [Catenovulum maritimum]KMT65237.1 hypothetical protein XM47_10130 [Catenovulum maritimum]
MKQFISAFVLLLTVGCVSPINSPKLSQSNIAVPDENRAVLIIYRKWVPPILYPVTAYVDNVEQFSLPNKSFSWVYLEPGEHQVKISWPLLAMTGSKKINITIQANKYYFLEFGGSMNATGVGSTFYTSHSFNFSDDIAYKKDVSDCCSLVK